MNKWRIALVALALVVASLSPHAGNGQTGEKKMDTRVYELRTYYIPAGKMDNINARFRNHTNGLLKKHGMELIGFWTDDKEPQRKLIYLVAHKNRTVADASWKAFGADPEWKKVAAESEKGGKIVEKVDRVWLNPTDYSALK